MLFIYLIVPKPTSMEAVHPKAWDMEGPLSLRPLRLEGILLLHYIAIKETKK